MLGVSHSSLYPHHRVCFGSLRDLPSVSSLRHLTPAANEECERQIEDNRVYRERAKEGCGEEEKSIGKCSEAS